MTRLHEAFDHAAELLLRSSQACETGLVSRIKDAIRGPSYASPRNGSVPDPTADAATSFDPARRDLDRLTWLAFVAVWAGQEAMRIVESYEQAVSPRPRFCVSCVRDEGWQEPVTLRPSGQAWYAESCRWCGAWKAAHGQYPPLELLRRKHTGQTITPSLARKHKQAG